jgi:hypothetical protein
MLIEPQYSPKVKWLQNTARLSTPFAVVKFMVRNAFTINPTFPGFAYQVNVSHIRRAA